MNTKTIAGVGVNLDNKANITYEQLMKSALTSAKYHGNPDAKRLINKELRRNGFRPNKQKSQKNK
ncbi:MAG: hypothetical protein ACUZ8H_01415 [Candidatus Anammoxibacter sp.]